jgi:hypothetical protein
MQTALHARKSRSEATTAALRVACAASCSACMALCFPRQKNKPLPKCGNARSKGARAKGRLRARGHAVAEEDACVGLRHHHLGACEAPSIGLSCVRLLAQHDMRHLHDIIIESAGNNRVSRRTYLPRPCTQAHAPGRTRSQSSRRQSRLGTATSSAPPL